MIAWFLVGAFVAAMAAAIVWLVFEVAWLRTVARMNRADFAALEKQQIDYQVASNTRHNDLVRRINEIAREAGWGDNLALTQELDPNVIGKLRRDTGRL